MSAVGSGPDQGPRSPIDQTLHELWWVALTVKAAVGVGLSDLLLQVISPGKIGAADAVHLGAVFLATYPLALAFAAFVLMAEMKVFSSLDSPWDEWSYIPLALVLFGGALYGGLYLAGESVDSGTLTEQGISYASPLHFAGTLLSAELIQLIELYWPGSFLAALVIGIYLGVKAASLFPKPPVGV